MCYPFEEMPATPLLRRLARSALAAPSPLRRGLAGPAPRNDRGVRLDPQLHLMLSLLGRANRPTLEELGVDEGRAEMRQLTKLSDVPPRPLHRVEDRWIAGPTGEIPVRLYTARPGRRPAILYFHGGGFVIGDLDTHDGLCRLLADRADAHVIAVHYRLAPENAFPAAVEDCVAAFRHVHANADAFDVDPDRIAVAGDSAGGNLSAVVCQQTRGGPTPAFQCLIYPATEMTRSHTSHRTFAEGFYLTTPMIDYFLASYLTTPEEETDPRASPLVTAELTGLPPAHVVVAGFDPLRDEGEAYAEALMGAGVPTTFADYSSLIHGFANMGGLIDAARWAVEDIADALHRGLHG